MTEPPDHSAAAFAALQAIQAGEWDRFLLRLRAAIRARIDTDDYQGSLRARRPAGFRRPPPHTRRKDT